MQFFTTFPYSAMSPLLAESFWERPSAFGIPFGALFLFWLVMQSLQTGNANAKQSRDELREMRRLQAKQNREKERLKNLPKCPSCGGHLEGEYPKCVHCGCNIQWIGGRPHPPDPTANEPDWLKQAKKKP